MGDISESGEVDALLKPFTDGEPAGRNLRDDASPQSLYFRMRDARSEARTAERLADNDPELDGGVPPQWTLVATLAAETLANHSKDVEIACWLLESLTRRHGLRGLATGADLLGGLIDGLWPDQLFPLAEEDDPEGRLAAITGLSGQDRDGSLMQPLRKTVLFERADGTPVNLWSYERSSTVSTLGGKAGAAKSAAAIAPFADLEADARGAGLEALRGVAQAAARAEASWKALEAVIAAKVPSEAQPSTGRVRDLLASLRQITLRYVPAAAEPAQDSEIAAADLPVAVAAQTGDGAPLPTRDREALLEEILRIAGVFQRSEPNSPIGFTLDEAVRRARMPWPDLLRELVADQSARASMMTIAGLRTGGAVAES